MKRLWIVLILGLCPASVRAQPRTPREFRLVPAVGPIAVDGRLDEPSWQQAAPIAVQYEYFPGDNTPATVETICLVTYDRDNLYVGCRAVEPDISSLRANLADRDVPRNDDSIGFMIDTFNDGRRAFQFRVNGRGVQMDAFNNDVDDSEDWTWDAIWDAAVQLGPDGYTAEVAVPFSSLRFPRACQFDKLSGFSAITPGRNLEFDPTLTAVRNDTRTEFPGPLSGGLTGRAGFSARWSVTPNVVFNGTANPDFYQVEADSAQLNVNDRFQLYFPEKRPFFLEGSDFFATPFNAVFTRTIVDPDYGMKLTGKEGPHAFGVFVAQDSVTGILFPGFESSSFAGFDQRHVAVAARYRRDVGRNGSTLGGLYTGRDSNGYMNRVAGADGLARVSRADSVRFQWVASRTRDPQTLAGDRPDPADAFGGQAFSARYDHGTRNWRWSGNVDGLSPTFRADAGFIPQVEKRGYQASVDRIFVGSSDRWFNEVTLTAGCDRTTDWNHRRASWGCDFPISYSGPLQLGAYYNPAPNSEYYRGQTYDNFRHQFSVNIRPSGVFSLYLNSTIGGAVDFANGRKGEQVRLFAGGSYNLFGRVDGTVDYTLQSLDVAGGRLFTAHLTQGQVVYHLNLRTFARAVLQYTDIMRDPTLYPLPPPASTRQLFSQYLFSYKVNPQTLFLVGYSDNASAAQTADLTRTDRTFFTKIGYAWVR